MASVTRAITSAGEAPSDSTGAERLPAYAPAAAFAAPPLNLNRNINGLNTIYEIQLKSVSSQLDSIDRVNRGIKDIRDMYEKSSAQSARYCEETEKMARYMQQLNSVYEKKLRSLEVKKLGS